MERDFEPVLQVSDDGYIRFSEQTLNTVRLRHLASGMDELGGPPISGCGDVALVTGYTEWFAGKRPYISLGWDWALDTSQGHISLKRISEPRSNVMLVDQVTKDRDMGKNLVRLASYIDRMSWASSVWPSIVQRYGVCNLGATNSSPSW